MAMNAPAPGGQPPQPAQPAAQVNIDLATVNAHTTQVGAQVLQGVTAHIDQGLTALGQNITGRIDQRAEEVLNRIVAQPAPTAQVVVTQNGTPAAAPAGPRLPGLISKGIATVKGWAAQDDADTHNQIGI